MRWGGRRRVARRGRTFLQWGGARRSAPRAARVGVGCIPRLGRVVRRSPHGIASGPPRGAKHPLRTRGLVTATHGRRLSFADGPCRTAGTSRRHRHLHGLEATWVGSVPVRELHGVRAGSCGACSREVCRAPGSGPRVCGRTPQLAGVLVAVGPGRAALALVGSVPLTPRVDGEIAAQCFACGVERRRPPLRGRHAARRPAALHRDQHRQGLAEWCEVMPRAP
jgi:hypothetical protein